MDARAFAVAADIVDTSFYTSPVVVDAIFDLLRATGFTGGRVLEPGCGSGNFMSRAPKDLTIDWTGVELDPTAAAFARTLNPDATIHEAPLQKVSLRSGSFHAVVGNVPFARGHVYDSVHGSASSLHEYFFLRALDAVMPGGYVIAVTSRHLIDGEHGLDSIGAVADLVAAVRLPSDTFDGTSVVADIVILRKLSRDGKRTQSWTEPTHEVPVNSWSHPGLPRIAALPHTIVTGAHTTTISGRWTAHLDCIAGTPEATGFYAAPVAVRTSNPARSIARAVAAARAFIVPADYFADAGSQPIDVVLTDEAGRKEGSFHLVGGKAHQVVAGVLTATARASAELISLIPLRDAALELIALESNPDHADHTIDPVREAALALYRAHTKKFGPLNAGTMITGKPDPETGEATLTWRRPTMGGFRKDPDYVAVLALENFDQDTGAAEPAAILLHRIGRRPPRPTVAVGVDEALAITLSEGRGVHLDRVRELLGLRNDSAALDALGDRVYRDPARRGDVVSRRDYLSGNVRAKLDQARAAAAREESYARNVAELEAVQPTELGPYDIRPQLGASWVTPDDIADFAADVIGFRVSVEYTPGVSYWEVSEGYGDSAEKRMRYSTPDFTGYQILAHALNGKTPVVYDTFYDPERRADVRVKNPTRTLAAEEKLRELQERFTTWLWEDRDRTDRVCAEYNRRFNSHILRRNDGSHLTFPGMDPSIELWAHQKDAVDRCISSERTMIAHPVGAGKTKSMIATAMTLRQMGLARKALIAVPGHLLEQIAREAQQAYPTGKFLPATKDDLVGPARRLFAARCATGDWDAVIMSHQAFTRIPVDPETEERWLQTEKAELRAHLISDEGGRRGAKQIASAVRKLDFRISALRDRVADPNQVTFNQLGIDYLMVDECHYLRRLPIATRAEGFNLGSSKRATDLLVKIDTLADRYPGKPIVALFTGTPWSNTLAETYVWQRMLQPDRLAEAAVAHFDAWAATFVRYETTVEVAPDGSGFRLYRRPATIQNVPELRLMLGEVADLLSAESIALSRPDAVWEDVVSVGGEAQLNYVASLAVRADAIRNPGAARGGRSRHNDNMLVVCNDGRRVALDPRLVGVPEDSPKLEEAAQRIARNFHDGRTTTFGLSATPGTFQLVLCDVGTPRADDGQTYGRLRRRLTELGVASASIRFIHDAKTDQARARLFAQCREGDVAVLIGSTDKVGVGVNAQTRLSHLHHLDAPWRPSDIIQREGRALRPGNLNKEVTIYRYITAGTFDAYMWQTLERKMRFIAQMYVSDGALREIDDVNETVLSYGQLKALAAGNPQLLRSAELAAEVRRLRVMRSVWGQGIRSLRAEAKDARASAAAERKQADLIEAAYLIAVDAPEPVQRDYLRDLEHLAGHVRDGGYVRTVTWRGLRLRTGGYGTKRAVGIELDYREVETFPLGAAVQRLSPATLAKHLDTLLTRWFESATERPGQLRASADRAETRAIDCETLAGADTFEHEPELQAAESELAFVEAQIRAIAEEADAAVQLAVAA
ncbi:helicase-related protein [Rathayibacter rathayi]|uniref:Methyltransferase type 11 n=1 Tax=Rathayibacter rathayi TaxID=33887 RepID=A0ABX5AFS4_RATRA|nr:helicase-related protein [Rathayibacter rathayi]PPF24275.1 methyltransferase type 11 [Rathayibacter rathayi]PPF51596.1 methyltransferase type 11 [Rathayibacter rathayi]PPF83187.1 methyltransferase type 11 [Rathayibacter rathayi]PPG47017.1 methyltransferase type 11 [Rathayibacter rathayi]PPG96522.1 methyltransferase type 11 [Rathayibacter rathayi]